MNKKIIKKNIEKMDNNEVFLSNKIVTEKSSGTQIFPNTDSVIIILYKISIILKMFFIIV